MSMSLLQVIEYGGYDLDTIEDATWLLATQHEYEELIEKAQALIDEDEEVKNAEAEAEYLKTFPKEEDDE